MDQHPVCLWPSTLIALCEWMQLKKCLSVATLNFLATHSSPHLIRAVQGECLQIQRQPSCSQYMLQQLIARDPACRGIQEWQRQERRLVAVPIQTVANHVEVHQRQKQEQHKRTETEAMKTSTEQTHDLSQLLSRTAPVAHADATCFPAAVRPARDVELTPKIGTACVKMETKTRKKTRRRSRV